jgi:hypothetical protein
MNTLELQQKLAAVNSKPPLPPEPPPKPVELVTQKDTTSRQASPPSEGGRENKAHIGAWLHKDFKKSLFLVRAQTGEDVQTIIARALNAEFRAHNVPVVDDR